MFTHRGGSHVRSGYYWHLAGWSLVTLSREGGVLPGDVEHRYVRLPMPVLLVVAPLMGGLYVMFLPLIGFVMVIGFLTKGATAAAGRALGALSATVAPAWRPGEAYFAGRREERERRRRTESDHKPGDAA